MDITGKVKFGKLNNKTILWSFLDLKEDTDTAILISDTIVGTAKYSDGGNTWEDSSLRKMLNHKIYQTLFSEAEKAAILPYTTFHAREDGMDDIVDYVFIPNFSQIKRANGNVSFKAGAPYWLRGRCENAAKIQCINSAGNMIEEGMYATAKNGVRICILVDLNKMQLKQTNTPSGVVIYHSEARAKGVRAGVIRSLIAEVGQSKEFTEEERDKFLSFLETKLGRI